MRKPRKRRSKPSQIDANVDAGTGSADRSGFSFVDAPAIFQDPAARLVRIPAGMRSKAKLLALLADKLEFPGYFGRNWDALEECLRDLSWLPANQSICLIHDDLPLRAGSRDRATYVCLLSECVTNNEEASHPIRVIFPSATTAIVQAVLNAEP